MLMFWFNLSVIRDAKWQYVKRVQMIKSVSNGTLIIRASMFLTAASNWNIPAAIWIAPNTCCTNNMPLDAVDSCLNILSTIINRNWNQFIILFRMRRTHMWILPWKSIVAIKVRLNLIELCGSTEAIWSISANVCLKSMHIASMYMHMQRNTVKMQKNATKYVTFRVMPWA